LVIQGKNRVQHLCFSNAVNQPIRQLVAGQNILSTIAGFACVLEDSIHRRQAKISQVILHMHAKSDAERSVSTHQLISGTALFSS